jgi:hypothetical protein
MISDKILDVYLVFRNRHSSQFQTFNILFSSLVANNVDDIEEDDDMLELTRS